MTKGSGVKGSPSVKYDQREVTNFGRKDEFILNFNRIGELSIENLKKYILEITNDPYYSTSIDLIGRDKDDFDCDCNVKFNSPLGLIIIDKDDSWEHDSNSGGISHIPIIGDIMIPSILNSSTHIAHILYAHGINIDLGLGLQSNSHYGDIYNPLKRKFEEMYKNGEQLSQYWDGFGRVNQNKFIYDI